jgi:cell division topological specificity factor
MGILSFFRQEKKKTASLAKDRLQIIVAHQRSGNRAEADYLPKLKEEILKVIAKYVDIDPDQIKVQLDTNDEQCPILELNVALPEHSKLMK